MGEERVSEVSASDPPAHLLTYSPTHPLGHTRRAHRNGPDRVGVPVLCRPISGRSGRRRVAQTACPHCGRTVTVPAAPQRAIPPAPPAPPETNSKIELPAIPGSPFEFAEPAKVLVNRRGEPVPLRRLSPAERERYRRRLNLVFALVGMAILSLALWCCCEFGPENCLMATINRCLAAEQCLAEPAGRLS